MRAGRPRWMVPLRLQREGGAMSHWMHMWAMVVRVDIHGIEVNIVVLFIIMVFVFIVVRVIYVVVVLDTVFEFEELVVPISSDPYEATKSGNTKVMASREKGVLGVVITLEAVQEGEEEFVWGMVDDVV
jgi:nitrogen fixation protein FixH